MGLKRIAVMMSTFNGASYLEEQIQSILLQTGVNITLFIRDDGSTDETVSVLEKYDATGQAIVTYGKNLGIGNSFLELLWSVPEDFDYYAFSDQDDIWQDDKLFTAVCRLNQESGCALYASNLEIVDADNSSIGMRFEPDIAFDGSLFSIICRSKCYGCTQVFNRDLFLLLHRKKPSPQMLKACLHDGWVSCSAAATGTIIYDNQSHIHYRRHGKNYTKFDQGKAAIWKQRFIKLFRRDITNPRSKKAREMIRLYPEFVEGNPDRDLIEILAEPTKLRNRAALIRHRNRFIADSGESEAWFVIKVIAGLV